MSNGNARSLRLRLSGAFACFRRPDIQIDMVSYDVLPPLAAQRILKGPLDRLGEFTIDAIMVLNPIKFEEHQINTAHGRRRVLALADVDYLLELRLSDDAGVGPSAPRNLIEPAVVFLGLSEFPGRVDVIDPSASLRSRLTGRKPLGWLPLERHDHEPVRATRYVRATMEDGRIDLRHFDAEDVAH